MGLCKYYKQKRQYKYVEDSTWYDVVPSEYQKGELYEYDSADCPDPIDYSKEYLTFIPTTGSSTFTFNGVSANTVSYSLDSGTTWVSLASSAASPSVSAGQKIMWKGTCVPQTSDNYPLGIGKFVATDKFIVEGNTMSLLYGDNFINQTDLTGKNSAFYELFSGNTNVVSAENLSLPATTLANNCYDRMFIFCSGLTTAPALPATTLAELCYNQMFYKCTSLTTAPELPATSLAPYCYYDMFGYCESLTTAPDLPATTLAERCYMLMFQYCSGLTTAPALPATTLVERCYNGMFQYCSSLNSITCLATDISATYCTLGWLHNVAASGTFRKASSMNSWPTGTSGIPNGWTVQNY